jgi:hypothetical protein
MALKTRKKNVQSIYRWPWEVQRAIFITNSIPRLQIFIATEIRIVVVWIVTAWNDVVGNLDEDASTMPLRNIGILNNFCRILTMVYYYWTNCAFGLYPQFVHWYLTSLHGVTNQITTWTWLFPWFSEFLRYIVWRLYYKDGDNTVLRYVGIQPPHLHGATIQKTTNFIFTVVKTSNLSRLYQLDP